MKPPRKKTREQEDDPAARPRRRKVISRSGASEPVKPRLNPTQERPKPKGNSLGAGKARGLAQGKTTNKPIAMAKPRPETRSQHQLATVELPDPIADWFKRRRWTLRSHQTALIEKGRTGRDTLLIAPTGAGKTLAGFLPTLIDLLSDDWRTLSGHRNELHTLYISPLKALAVDVAR